MMALPTLMAGILLAVLALASARLLAQAVRVPAAGFRRPRAWRVSVLIALHALSAALLWLTLFPPLQTVPAAGLTVFTAGADATASGPAVTLPEAPQGLHGERVPDLATALRRHGTIGQLHVIGNGLSARDRDAAQGLDLLFSPGAEPSGLIDLHAPHWPRAGQYWQVRGRVQGSADTRAVLLAPDDNIIDSAPIDREGRFVLNAQARSPGQTVFQLRLLDADDQVQASHAVAVATRSGDPLRVAVYAGGSNAELKYLRRWLRDAGVPLRSELRISPTVSLRDRALDLSADNLAQLDVLMIDDRAWYGLASSVRDAIVRAARGGLGVLLLLTGEPDREQRQQLTTLGFAVAAADVSRTVRLHRQQPIAAANSDDDAPAAKPLELSRRALHVAAAASQPLLRADDGEALALWRASGRGRVALWWLTDSFRLVLSGAASEHANLWRDALSTIARPRAIAAPQITPERPRDGTRLTLCAATDMQVQTPTGQRVALLPRRLASGQRCAGFWPQADGWHVVQSADQQWPFYVYPRNQDAAMQAWHDRHSTAQLATFAGTAQPAQASTRASPWPYALAWLLALAMLWVFERLPVGYRPSTAP